MWNASLLGERPVKKRTRKPRRKPRRIYRVKYLRGETVRFNPELWLLVMAGKARVTVDSKAGVVTFEEVMK